MLKQIEIDGQRFETCSLDGGRTWSSDLRSLLAYKRRREQAFAQARKGLEQIDEATFKLDPNDTYELRLPRQIAA